MWKQKDQTGDPEQQSRKEIVISILRMSQKALGYVLALIGVGYIGGLFAIFFKPDIAVALTSYAEIFIPVFQLEIGVYGLGSTLENIQKIKKQVDSLTTSTESDVEETEE